MQFLKSLNGISTCGKTYVVQRISCQVDPVAETPIDSEGKVIVCVIRDPLALQDELDDPRTSGLSEKIRTIDVESETQCMSWFNTTFSFSLVQLIYNVVQNDRFCRI